MSSSYEQDLREDQIKTNIFDPVVLWRLLRYARPYLWLGVATFAVTTLIALLELAAPIIISGAVDIIFPTGAHGGAQGMRGILSVFGLGHFGDWLVEQAAADRLTLLWWFSAAYLCARVLQSLLAWGNGYLLAMLSQNVLYDIRMDVFRHVQTRSLSYFHRNPVGRLVTRVTNDVGALDEFFSQALVSVLKDLVLPGCIVALLFIANWKLALIVMLVLPPLIAISAIFRFYARRAYRDFRAALSRLNAKMAETANGIREVQLFDRQAKNQEEFETIAKDYRQHFLRHRHAWALYRPGYTTIQATAMALVIWFGGAWVLDTTLGIRVGASAFTPGMLTLFVLLAELFFHPIRDLVEKFDTIQSALTASERIFTVLDAGESIPVKADGHRVARLHGDVRFRDVHFEYIKGEPVLKGVSFEASAGQCVAIVGHTGAGKTTIINLLSRFYDVQGGQVEVDGIDVRAYDLYALRARIAVVHQDVFLFAGTVAENISLGNPSISRAAVEAAARAVHAHEFIERLHGGYEHHVVEQGKTFSAGERQLLSFARALAHDPDILVLDEATSSIDTRSEQLIQDAMRVLLARRTSIIIAHRLSTIQNADLLLVMEQGTIVERGKHAELLKHKGLYHRLYELQLLATSAGHAG